MSRVDFAYGAAHRLRTACHAAARHVGAGRRLLVYCTDERRLRRFDALLWEFEPTSFIPHTRAGDPLADRADVILVTGTSYEAATDALQGLRVNGRLVLATIDPAGSFTISPASPVWAQRQKIIGATHNGLEHLEEALRLVADGEVTPLVETFPKEQVAEAVARLAKGEVRFRAVITY